MCNGVTERYNAVILDTVSHYVNRYQNDWDEYLKPIQFAHRSCTQQKIWLIIPHFSVTLAGTKIDYRCYLAFDIPSVDLRNYMLSLQHRLTVIMK